MSDEKVSIQLDLLEDVPVNRDLQMMHVLDQVAVKWAKELTVGEFERAVERFKQTALLVRVGKWDEQ